MTEEPGAAGVGYACLARTPASILSPRFLSTLCQYSKARCQDRFGHAVEQVADDVADQAVAGGVVEDVADHRARLAPVVVLRVRDIGRTDHVAVGVPADGPIVLAVGLRAALGVRRVHRIVDVDDAHRAVLAVGVHRHLRRVHRDLLVVHAQPGAVRVGVGEPAGQQHLVRAQRDAGHQVVRLERRLFHLGVVVGQVAVQGQPADLDQRVVAVRPDLGQVERVEPVVLGFLERHDLHLQRPARELAARDRVIQVALVVVGVRRRPSGRPRPG